MSLSDNEYSRIVLKKTDSELLEVLNEYEKYVIELLEAAVLELEKRNLRHPLQDKIKAQIQEANIPAQIIETPVNIDAPEKESVVSSLYSRTAILGFSLFFSTLTGGILLAINASKVNKKAVIPIIVFALLFTAMQIYASFKIPAESFLSFVIPVAGALLLSDVLWNYYIGKTLKYEKRSIAIPLVIVLIISLPVLYMAYYHPEFFTFTETK